MLGIGRSEAVGQKQLLGFIIGGAEIQVGFAGHQQHPCLDCPQRRAEITVIQIVGADIRSIPGAKLGVEIGGRPYAEAVFPVGFQECLQVRGAQIGFRTVGQMLADPIEILAERPGRIDAPECPFRRAGFGGEPAVADVLRRSLQRCHQGAQEYLIMHRGSGNAAVHHDPFHRVREQRGPVVGLQRTHRPAIDACDMIDAEQVGQCRRCTWTLSCTVTSVGYSAVSDGEDDRPLPNISGMTMNQRVGSRILSGPISHSRSGCCAP